MKGNMVIIMRNLNHNPQFFSGTLGHRYPFAPVEIFFPTGSLIFEIAIKVLPLPGG
jgi:hypothetical protein